MGKKKNKVKKTPRKRVQPQIYTPAKNNSITKTTVPSTVPKKPWEKTTKKPKPQTPKQQKKPPTAKFPTYKQMLAREIPDEDKTYNDNFEGPEEEEWWYSTQHRGARADMFFDVDYNYEDKTWFEDWIYDFRSDVEGIWYDSNVKEKGARKFEDVLSRTTFPKFPSTDEQKKYKVSGHQKCQLCHSYKKLEDQLHVEKLIYSGNKEKINAINMEKDSLVGGELHNCPKIRCEAFNSLDLNDCPTRSLDAHRGIRIAYDIIKKVYAREKKNFNLEETKRINDIQPMVLIQKDEAFYDSPEFEKNALEAARIPLNAILEPDIKKAIVDSHKKKIKEKEIESTAGPDFQNSIQQDLNQKYQKKTKKEKKESKGKKRKQDDEDFLNLEDMDDQENPKIRKLEQEIKDLTDALVESNQRNVENFEKNSDSNRQPKCDDSQPNPDSNYHQKYDDYQPYCPPNYSTKYPNYPAKYPNYPPPNYPPPNYPPPNYPPPNYQSNYPPPHYSPNYSPNYPVERDPPLFGRGPVRYHPEFDRMGFY